MLVSTSSDHRMTGRSKFALSEKIYPLFRESQLLIGLARWCHSFHLGTRQEKVNYSDEKRIKMKKKNGKRKVTSSI